MSALKQLLDFLVGNFLMLLGGILFNTLAIPLFEQKFPLFTYGGLTGYPAIGFLASLIGSSIAAILWTYWKAEKTDRVRATVITTFVSVVIIITQNVTGAEYIWLNYLLFSAPLWWQLIFKHAIRK